MNMRVYHNAVHDLKTPLRDRLVGLMVKASTSRAEDPGFESRHDRIFPGRVIPVT